MQDKTRETDELRHGVVYALGEEPLFHAGDQIRVLNRSPIGHYRVPTYLRGKAGVIEAVTSRLASTTRRKATVETRGLGFITTASPFR